MPTQWMKTLSFLAPTMLVGAFALPASAHQSQATGRVISANPLIENVNTPRQECRTEYQQQRIEEPRGVGGALLGGVAGGVIGSAIGQGNGRVVSAAIGAGIGAITGDRIANAQNAAVIQTIPVQVCTQIDQWSTITTGYEVTYEYQGQRYQTITQQHPGEMIALNVTVTPQVSASPTLAPQVVTTTLMQPVPANVINHITYGSPAYVVPQHVPSRVIAPIVVLPHVMYGGNWQGVQPHRFNHRFRGHGGHAGWGYRNRGGYYYR